MNAATSASTGAITRRSVLLSLFALPLLGACAKFSSTSGRSVFTDQLAQLEAESGGRLGVFALNTASGSTLSHRPDERFPMCSTFKLMLAAAVLKRAETEPDLMERVIPVEPGDLLKWAPAAKERVGKGMTVTELCSAAMQVSDNTAANLLLRLLGGPEALTAFARSIGDEAFRLDRWEPELNTAIPGDPRDTTTPAAMARSLERLALGDALAPAQRGLLLRWLEGNATGAGKIRAGVPEGWRVGDKTGSGDYGTTNDVAVILPPSGSPLIVAVYLTQPVRDAAYRIDALASAARIAVLALR
ncbi:class A beta-lactamase [Fundidesulfovibrio agrisoli]|uniref:class A beta-lactamase n=1 Tax=Fundidesulfovibrio agrisoli TaxID=2922717 RepID=UPI001FADD6AD|nr:class A beta-lactamase [Fundidesulfovibrio agrisoli]